MRALAVQGRVHVGTASQDQSIYALHQGIGRASLAQGRRDDWYEPCVLKGCEVGRSEASRGHIIFATYRGTNCYNRTE